MKINFINVGNTDSEHLKGLIADYEIRIKRFVNFQIDYVSTPRNLGKLKPADIKKSEGELILKKIEPAGIVILLDERGNQYTSQEFARYLQRLMMNKTVYFVTGGAYGFSDDLYNRANEKLSLSKMTTTHQLVRLFFAEQLYRAFTIINNHPYHNE